VTFSGRRTSEARPGALRHLPSADPLNHLMSSVYHRA